MSALAVPEVEVPEIDLPSDPEFAGLDKWLAWMRANGVRSFSVDGISVELEPPTPSFTLMRTSVSRPDEEP